ncbi:transposase [Halomonas sediminis]
MPRKVALRKGRTSSVGHDYLVTIVTRNRDQIFSSFWPACQAAHHFYHPVLSCHATTLSFVVMPDHVHWLFKLEGNLSEAVRLYKAKVSLSLGKSVWQDGFHDHVLRKDEDLRKVARYIVANPLRAGLVDNIMDYAFWDAVWL